MAEIPRSIEVEIVPRWSRAADPSDLAPLIKNAVLRTVLRHSKGHYPDHVAASVSGGIDSSSVCAFLPEDFLCVTGWYDAEGCDEREWAAQIVRERPWLEIEITPEKAIQAAVEIKQRRVLAGLRCGPGAIGQHVVARAVREELHTPATIITGEGGDELFGGYARQMMALGFPIPDGYDDLQLDESYPTTLRAVLDVEWQGLRTLTQVDERIAGDFGLQVATPLLDPWVVAWTFQQPFELRIGKQLIREAMRGHVPNQILDRTDKRGFPVPFVAWAQDDPWRGFLEEWIGYVPDLAEPYSRQWWYDFLDA